jgi:hypothetical protein
MLKISAAWCSALLLPALSAACSPFICENLEAGNPKLCQNNDFSVTRPDSAWHVRIVRNSALNALSANSCVVEQTPAFKTTQDFVDVELIEILYSDVGALQIGTGDEIRLDFGSWTEYTCSPGAPDTLPPICFNSCGPVVSDIFNKFRFEEGKEYVLFANQLPWPRSLSDELFAAPSPATESDMLTNELKVKDACGKEARFYVASGENCDNNLVEPSADTVGQFKVTCGVTENPGVTESEGTDTVKEGPISKGALGAVRWMELIGALLATVGLLV